VRPAPERARGPHRDRPVVTRPPASILATQILIKRPPRRCPGNYTNGQIEHLESDPTSSWASSADSAKETRLAEENCKAWAIQLQRGQSVVIRYTRSLVLLALEHGSTMAKSVVRRRPPSAPRPSADGDVAPVKEYRSAILWNHLAPKRLAISIVRSVLAKVGVMENYQWFLLGVMVAWTPGAIVVTVLMLRPLHDRAAPGPSELRHQHYQR
jgi:hypothetical protein